MTSAALASWLVLSSRSQCEWVSVREKTIVVTTHHELTHAINLPLRPQSQFLKDCFAELDVPGASRITIHMTPGPPYLSMDARGDSSSCCVDFPVDEPGSAGTDVFTEFESKGRSSNSYSLNLIRPCAKALAKADHTNVRVNKQGMLSMQHVIPSGDSADSNNWVEFLITALEDEGDMLD